MKLEHNITTEDFLNQLYTTYSKFIYKEAWKYCNDSEDVDDLVQEVWVKLCSKGDMLSGFSKQQHCTYLSAAVRNTAISLARKKRETLPLDFAEQYGYNEPELLNERLDRQLTVDLFRKAWPQIPLETREILERKYILSQSDKEIARTMQIGENSVRMYLTRARKTALALLKNISL